MTKTFTVVGVAGALVILAAFSSMPAPAMVTNETNVTVIYKTNPNWPIRGMISVDPCDIRKCQEV